MLQPERVSEWVIGEDLRHPVDRRSGPDLVTCSFERGRQFAEPFEQECRVGLLRGNETRIGSDMELVVHDGQLGRSAHSRTSGRISTGTSILMRVSPDSMRR